MADETNGSAPAAAKEDKSRMIKMDDGREVKFGEKTRLKKDYGVDEATGNTWCRIDFDNGKVIKVEVAPGSALLLQAAGHGLSQKLGDSAANAENTEDAFESILEVAARLNKGEWNKASDGTGSAKGASELVEAMSIYLNTTKEAVRDMMVNLSAGDKAALRKVPDVAKAIEQVRANRKPTKAEEDKIAKAADLLAKMKAGETPAGTPAAEATPA